MNSSESHKQSVYVYNGVNSEHWVSRVAEYASELYRRNQRVDILVGGGSDDETGANFKANASYVGLWHSNFANQDPTFNSSADGSYTFQMNDFYFEDDCTAGASCWNKVQWAATGWTPALMARDLALGGESNGLPQDYDHGWGNYYGNLDKTIRRQGARPQYFGVEFGCLVPGTTNSTPKESYKDFVKGTHLQPFGLTRQNAESQATCTSNH